MGWLVFGLLLATVIVARSGHKVSGPMTLAFIAGCAAAWWAATWWATTSLPVG